MQKLRVIAAVVALVWGNSSFAALSPSQNGTGGDLPVRISLLLEHFAHKHPELNVQVREKFSDYNVNARNARRVYEDLTRLDIIQEQHQPAPPPSSLHTVTCKHAVCHNEEETESREDTDEAFLVIPGVKLVTCKKPACLDAGM